MTKYWVISKTMLSSFIRDWQALVFSLVLPLVFLFIFGSLYADMGDNTRVSYASVYIEHDDANNLISYLDNSVAISYSLAGNMEGLIDSVRFLEADFGLSWDGNELTVFTNPVRVQDNSYFEQIGRSIRNKIEKDRTGLIDLVQVNRIFAGFESGDDSQVLSMVDLLFPGIIALGVCSSGLFAITSWFMHYKQREVLKRLLATSMRKIDFMSGLVITRVIVSFCSALVTLLAGSLLFKINFSVNWGLFALYVVISTMIMMGLGALITLVVKTAENAGQLGSILFTIMMFFSGIYFPVEFLPSYFQKISVFLPLSYVAQSFRHIMGVEIMPLGSFIMQTIVMFTGAVILIWTATIKSRWVEK